MFKILCVFALCALLAFPTEAVFSQRLMLLVRPKLKQCAEKNNVTEAELERIIANDLSNTSKNAQCLALCFMNKLGMFDAQGNINTCASKFIFSLGENPLFVNRVVNKCKNLKGSNPCETAFKVYGCYVQEKLL